MSDHPRPPGYVRSAGQHVDPSGLEVTDAGVLARLRALAVPPAWEHVWVALDPEAKVQAVGVDRAGRTQYRYSAEWTASRAREKFDHVPEFAAALPGLREHVRDRVSGSVVLDRDSVLSVAVRLLDLGFFRVGSERYGAGGRRCGGLRARRSPGRGLARRHRPSRDPRPSAPELGGRPAAAAFSRKSASPVPLARQLPGNRRGARLRAAA